MNKKKEYLIELFIKKACTYNRIVVSLEKTFELLAQRYPNVLKCEVEEIKKKYIMDGYIKAITPIIDNAFSERELEEIVLFYTSKTGAKLISLEFAKQITNCDEKLFLDIDKEFRNKNDRTKQKNP